MVSKMAREYADKDFDAQFDAFMKEVKDCPWISQRTKHLGLNLIKIA